MVSLTMSSQKKDSNRAANVAFAVLASLLLITTSLTIYSFVKCTDLESRLVKLEQFIERKIHESASEMGEVVKPVHLRKRRDATDQLSDLSLHELLSLRGPPGRDGKDGKDGQDGAVGTPGQNGHDGTVGAPGQNGLDGRDGRDGKDGEDGADGQDGAVGPQGLAGQIGATGPQGPAGQIGAAGQEGLNGHNGSPGRDGQDGIDGRDCDCSKGIVSSTTAASTENHQNNSISNQLAHIMESIEELRTGQQHEHSDKTPTTSVVHGGSTYIRWGRTSCGNSSQLLYQGFAAGQVYTQEGGSSEYACLPLDPEFNQWSPADSGNWIYGAEYQSNHNSPGIFPSDAQDKNVPCSQCYTPGRSAVMMIPAKRTCPDSWTKEYEGYLMTEYPTHKRSSNYACVDAQPEYISGSHANTNGALFYFVQAECSTTHHCPPYISSAELTCVICSK